jgi:hypothetical protein
MHFQAEDIALNNADLGREVDHSSATTRPLSLQSPHAFSSIRSDICSRRFLVTFARRVAGRYLSAELHGTYRPDYPVFEFERMLQLMKTSPGAIPP